MRYANLTRFSTGSQGTFGVLHTDNNFFCYTAERPWRDNKPMVSCIPEGRYACTPKQSPKFGETFEVVNVFGRTDILFHVGNYPLVDTEGCILVGRALIAKPAGIMLYPSAPVFLEFKKEMGDDEFILTIRNVWPALT